MSPGHRARNQRDLRTHTRYSQQRFRRRRIVITKSSHPNVYPKTPFVWYQDTLRGARTDGSLSRLGSPSSSACRSGAPQTGHEMTKTQENGRREGAGEEEEYGSGRYGRSAWSCTYCQAGSKLQTRKMKAFESGCRRHGYRGRWLCQSTEAA